MVGGEWKKGNTFKILIALLSMFLLKNGEDDYPKGKFERFNTEWRGQTKRRLFSEERINILRGFRSQSTFSMSPVP